MNRQKVPLIHRGEQRLKLRAICSHPINPGKLCAKTRRCQNRLLKRAFFWTWTAKIPSTHQRGLSLSGQKVNNQKEAGRTAWLSKESFQGREKGEIGKVFKKSTFKYSYSLKKWIIQRRTCRGEKINVFLCLSILAKGMRTQMDCLDPRLELEWNNHVKNKHIKIQGYNIQDWVPCGFDSYFAAEFETTNSWVPIERSHQEFRTKQMRTEPPLVVWELWWRPISLEKV